MKGTKSIKKSMRVSNLNGVRTTNINEFVNCLHQGCPDTHDSFHEYLWYVRGTLLHVGSPTSPVMLELTRPPPETVTHLPGHAGAESPTAWDSHTPPWSCWSWLTHRLRQSPTSLVIAGAESPTAWDSHTPPRWLLELSHPPPETVTHLPGHVGAELPTAWDSHPPPWSCWSWLTHRLRQPHTSLVMLELSHPPPETITHLPGHAGAESPTAWDSHPPPWWLLELSHPQPETITHLPGHAGAESPTAWDSHTPPWSCWSWITHRLRQSPTFLVMLELSHPPPETVTHLPGDAGAESPTAWDSHPPPWSCSSWVTHRLRQSHTSLVMLELSHPPPETVTHLPGHVGAGSPTAWDSHPPPWSCWSWATHRLRQSPTPLVMLDLSHPPLETVTHPPVMLELSHPPPETVTHLPGHARTESPTAWDSHTPPWWCSNWVTHRLRQSHSSLAMLELGHPPPETVTHADKCTCSAGLSYVTVTRDLCITSDAKHLPACQKNANMHIL